VITDRIMLDVLKSTTMEYGDKCVLSTLTGAHKSPALCLDLGDFAFSFQRLYHAFVTV